MVLFLFTSYSIRIQENISQRKGIMTDETTAVLPAQDESSEEGNGSRKSMQERMDNFHCEEYQKYFPEDPHEAEYLRTLLSSGGRGAVERQKVLVKLSLASGVENCSCETVCCNWLLPVSAIRISRCTSFLLVTASPSNGCS